MADQSKKETILDERVAPSVDLKGSSSAADALLPSVVGSEPDATTGGSNAGSACEPEANSSATENQADALNETEAPRTEDGFDQGVRPNLSPYQYSQAQNTDGILRSGTPPGVVRHRLVIAACFLASICFLGLSTLDLKTAFKVPIQLDNQCQLTYPKKRPSLPPNLQYLYTSRETNGVGPFHVTEASWTGMKVGLVNSSGAVILKPTYKTISNFSDGLAVVSTEDGAVKVRYGYIDASGKAVIKPQYNDADSFHDGVALVSTSGSTYQLVNRTGKVLFQAQLEEHRYLGNGVYCVREKNGRTGLLSNSGVWLVPPDYDGIVDFNWRNYNSRYETASTAGEKYFKITRNGKCGVVDSQGQIIIPPTYNEIASYANGHAAVLVNDKWGFADSKGKLVIKPEYEFVTAYADLIAAKTKEKWMLLDSSGKVVSGAPIEGAIAENGEPWLINERAPVVINDKVGYVNGKGIIAIKPIYNWGTVFSNGFASVFDGRYWNLIDKNGHSPLKEKLTDQPARFSGGVSGAGEVDLSGGDSGGNGDYNDTFASGIGGGGAGGVGSVTGGGWSAYQPGALYEFGMGGQMSNSSDAYKLSLKQMKRNDTGDAAISSE